MRRVKAGGVAGLPFSPPPWRLVRPKHEERLVTLQGEVLKGERG